MPYHGLRSSRISELSCLRQEDLRAYADEAVDIGAGLGDEVVVAGISGGATIAAWAAANRAEVDRALLLAPFFGLKGLSAFANTLLMNLFGRLPNLNFYHRYELPREWVYRGQSSRGVAAFLGLARQVRQEAERGIVPTGRISVITTAADDTANNALTAGLLDKWREAGVPVTSYEFGPEQFVTHNSVDPAADEGKRRAVHDRILALLGERDS
jgi:carboxylesterase